MSERYIGPDIFLLEHFQQPHDRHSYLRGLAIDCYLNLGGVGSDRNSHYLARECYWNQRPKTALKEFKRHIAFNAWPAEKAESLMFCGDIYGQLNDPTEQALNYAHAYHVDSERNTAFIKLAQFYLHNHNYRAAIAYAKGALDYKYSGFYADDPANYKQRPHEILYRALGFCGRVEEAKYHLDKCLEFAPYDQQYLFDTRYYNEFGAPMIDGWMRWPETQFLYYESKKHNVIVEVGSWKGRSTTCICSGNKDAKVFAVDTWAGSSDERDLTNSLAKKEDIYQTFLNNTKQFSNLTPIRKSSVEAAKDFEDGSVDWIFVDAGHTYLEVKEDVLTWLPKLKIGGIMSGHDFEPSVWMEVCRAVNEIFHDRKINVVDSIWWVENDLPREEFVENINIEFRHSNGEIVTEQNPAVEPETFFIERNIPINIENQIPRRVYTCWLGESMPEIVRECIESQKRMCERFGYEHRLITLDNLPGDLKYIQECLSSTYPAGVKYCKAADYLRFWYLYNEGGVFLDSDVRIRDGKDFGEMLGDKMFIGLELADWANGKVVLGTAVMGSMPKHEFLLHILNRVTGEFRGDDNLCYESSMQILNQDGVNFQKDFKLYEPEFFHPKNSFTGQLDHLTEKTICIHEFTKFWTPENNAPKSTLQQFKYNIENNINFTFVKRGDGELACMNGEVGQNCDGHPYSKELGDKLREAYAYLETTGAHIVDFGDQKNYNVLLHRTDNNLSELSDFYKAIAKSSRRKVLVAPPKLSAIAYLLNAYHVSIPEVNVWASYNWVLENLPYDKDTIYMFCAGMPAKGLIADFYKLFHNATYIDCGSAFDPSFSETRTWQITKEQFWELYKPSFGEIYLANKDSISFQEKTVGEKTLANYSGNSTTNNFNLPQDTHPERLWVINNLK